MKKIIILIIIGLLAVFTAFAEDCPKEINDSEIKEQKLTCVLKTENGKKEVEYYLGKKIRNIWYHSNGKKGGSLSYNGDKKYGTWVWHDDIGRIIRTKFFYNDKEISSFLCLKKGYLNEDRIERDSISCYYYLFHNGKKNKNISYEGAFEDGSQHGLWRWYYPNGKLKRIGEYELGQLTGVVTTFYTDGTVKEVEKY